MPPRRIRQRISAGFSILRIESMDIKIGDKLLMKKPHPCGNNIFIVMRSGADLRLKCAECGREIMIERIKAQKNIKKVMREEDA